MRSFLEAEEENIRPIKQLLCQIFVINHQITLVCLLNPAFQKHVCYWEITEYM